MTQTPKLKLPYIMPAQAQKHVTHNEALKAIDVLSQIAVDDFSTDRPIAPHEGQAIIIQNVEGTTPSADSNMILYFQDGAWQRYSPMAGWVAWIKTLKLLFVFDGFKWVQVQNTYTSLPLLGINTDADLGNKFAIKSEATLFDNEGAGHQLKINKAETSETASLIFQNAYSGNAEIGLTGDNDLHVKVSSDGQNFKEAITVRTETGAVDIPKLNFLQALPSGTETRVINNGEIDSNTGKPIEILLIGTENGAPVDELHTITGGLTGQILILRSPTSSRDPKVIDSLGNLKLAGDFIFTRSDDILVLIKIGSQWLEISRSDNRS